MSILKLDPKTNKLIIEIDESGGDSSQAFRNDPPPPSTLGALPAAPPRYLRHKRPTLSSGFINVYDFGLYKPDLHGDFQDRVITYLATLEEAKNQTDAVLQAVRDAVRPALNAPLDYPVSEWTSRFKKLSFEGAAKYRFDIAIDSTALDNEPLTGDNDNWTEKGLKFETMDILATAFPGDALYTYYQLGGLFPYFFHSGGCKVTKTPHFEGDPATFKLTPKGGDVNIFINPCFFFMDTLKYLNEYTSNETIGGSSAYFVYYFNDCSSPTRFPANVAYSNSHTLNTEKVLNYFYSTWRRSQVLNNPAPFIDPFDVLHYFTQEMRKHPQAREIDTVNEITTSTVRAFPTFPMGGVPSLATRLCNWGYPSNPADVSNSNISSTVTPDPLTFPVDDFPSTNAYEIIVNKALAAVVIQKSDIYYIWRQDNL